MSMKVALITGAAKRVGAEIARALHQKNMNVIIHYSTSAQDAEKLCQELNQIRQHSAAILQANLEKIDLLQKFFEKAHQIFGRLDVLVNNACSFYPTKIGETTQTQWENLFSTNAQAPFFLSQAAAPYLAMSSGNIINMIDIHAERPMKQHTVYCMSKAALATMTKSLARELSPNIRVNGIAPGMILWPDAGMSETIKQSILNHIPLARAGTPDHIVKTVLFLLENDYMTGQIIAVDGGRSLFI
jgi:pteridine reductase